MKVSKSKRKTSKPTSFSQRIKSASPHSMVVVALLFGIVGVAYLQFSSAQKLKTDRIKVIAHNQTEGNMLSIYWKADVLLFSETDQAKIRRQAPAYFNWYFPDGDSHQAIGWNSKTMRIDATWDARKSFRFHRSGQAEGWRNVATPARFIHEVDLVNRATGVPVTVYETWWLNSWRNEANREKIVRETTIPVVKARFAKALERDRIGIAGGDFNHITYDFNGRHTFPGWNTAPARGLDRLFWTKDSRITFHGVKQGPSTGVGNQMRHHSLIAEFTLRNK